MGESEASRRIEAAIKVCNLLREAIEQNGNVYSGSLIPNLTSVTDVLGQPFEVIEPALAEIDARFDAFMSRAGFPGGN